ncbi:MAG: cell division protein FtsZ [Alphaproteobacteria bacterium]|nr:cell division protein FtsZ [Alphaproteobacteria bacterium]
MIDIKIQPTDMQKLSPKITVIGVGGAGGNAVNNMISSNLEGCEFLVCNTDSQALQGSLVDDSRKVQLGTTVTGGLGAGSKPEVGRAAAEESLDEVLQYLEGANMVFVTAGMGGGTGTGAAPVIAKACRERGILTVGVVTKPFHFEGSHRMKSAESGIKEMQDFVDTLIVIPNQNLFRIANEKTTFAESFQMADGVLQAGVRGVTDLMVKPGLVNLDFADIRTAMMEMGKAMMGTGEAEGEKRAVEAAESAINNPLLDDVSMKGAHGVIINVTGGYDMTLFEADEACNRIRDEVDPDANIIFGATFDENLNGKMRVSIIATGIEKEADAKTGSEGGSLKAGSIDRQGLERAKPSVAAPNAAPQTSVNTPMSAPMAPSVSAPTVPSFQGRQPSLPATGPSTGAPVFMSAQSVQAMRAPAVSAPAVPSAPAASVPLSQGSAAIATQDPELDMFEQHKFAEAGQGNDMSSISRNTALRGTRYNDAFIPPRPVEAPSGTGSYMAGFHGEHVPSDAPQEQQSSSGQSSASAAQQAGTAPGLKLNPPRPPAGTQRKRTPSLFERISDTVHEHLEGRRSDQQQGRPAQTRTAPSAQSSGGYGAGDAGGVPQNASQGRLNIDAPSKQSQSDDELDIPAFLRRQAN